MAGLLEGKVAVITGSGRGIGRGHAAGRAGRFSLINTTSSSGIILTLPGGSSYSSSKAAINAFTLISSLELADYGVRVNAVSPTGYTQLSASMTGQSDHRETELYE